MIAFLLPLLIAVDPAPLVVEGPNLRGRLILDRVRLSPADALLLRLRIEGTAPLEIPTPTTILREGSVGEWELRRLDGPTRHADGRVWEIRYRCVPRQPNGCVPLSVFVGRIRVGTGGQLLTLAWPTVEIQVTPTIARPSLEELHGESGIEPLPPADVATADRFPRSLLVLIPVPIVVCLVLRRRRKPPEPTPHEWAESTLAAFGPSPSLHDLADVLRGFLQRRFGCPATYRTFAELLNESTLRERLSNEQAIGLTDCVERLDHARFAPAAEELSVPLRAVVSKWIRSVAPDDAVAANFADQEIHGIQ